MRGARRDRGRSDLPHGAVGRKTLPVASKSTATSDKAPTASNVLKQLKNKGLDASARKEFSGDLAGYDHGAVTLRIGEEEMRFEKDAVALVRLRCDF